MNRDRQFFQWRYGDPKWECVTYVGHRDGSPSGAIITATKGDSERITALMDSLPLTDDGRDPAVIARLLSTIIRDHRESRLLRAAGSIVPDRFLWQYGFLRDDLPLVSRFTSRTEIVARPFDADDSSAWELGGFRIDREGDWIIALGDQDAPF